MTLEVQTRASDGSTHVEKVAEGTPAEKGTPEAKPAPAADAKPAGAPSAPEIELDPEDQELGERARKRIAALLFKQKQADAAAKKAVEAQRDADAFGNEQYLARLAAERRLAELEARSTEQPPREAPADDSAKEPVRENFKTDAEFWEAKIDWRAEQKVKAFQAQQREEAAQAEAAREDQARAERNKAFAATVDDWAEAAEALAAAHPEAPPGYMQAYIMKSPMSAAVMYHFGKNPGEYTRILNLGAKDPVLAVAALGRLEARLEKKAESAPAAKAEESAPAARSSKAPPPITPLNGGTEPVQKDPREMTTREVIELEEAKRRSSAYRRQRH